MYCFRLFVGRILYIRRTNKKNNVMNKLMKFGFAALAVVFSIASCSETTAQSKESVQEVAKSVEMSMSIEGMTCEMGCARAIEVELKNIEGVIDAVVDFKSTTATVNYNPSVTSDKVLVDFVNSYKNGTYSAKLVKTCADKGASKCCSSKKSPCSEAEKAKCASEKKSCEGKDKAKCADKSKCKDGKKSCAGKDASKCCSEADKAKCATGKKSCTPEEKAKCEAAKKSCDKASKEGKSCCASKKEACSDKQKAKCESAKESCSKADKAKCSKAEKKSCGSADKDSKKSCCASKKGA